MEEIEIVSEGDGEYRARTGSLYGNTSVTLVLGGVDDASEGRLTDDEPTARAALQYLLSHQDAGDLPARIEVEDVFAAYPDAVDKIEALRDETGESA